MKNANFDPVTMKRIQDFQHGKDKLFEDYPEVTMVRIRDYIQSGIRYGMTDDLVERLNTLNNLRKRAIAFVMETARRQAADDGITIPQKYLDGSALDPVFAPETYRFEEFKIYSWLSWYTKEEEGTFAMGPLFSL